MYSLYMYVLLDLWDQVLYCIYVWSLWYVRVFSCTINTFCMLMIDLTVIKAWMHVTHMIYITYNSYNMICLICVVCSDLCNPYCLFTYDRFGQCVRDLTMFMTWMICLIDMFCIVWSIWLICNVLVWILKIDLICVITVCIHVSHMITYVRSMWSRWLVCDHLSVWSV
jgi:hypothetical protein